MRYEAPHRVGERQSALDVGSRVEDSGREALVGFLCAKNLETLHKREAGIDHHRELAREDGDVIGLDLVAADVQLDVFGYDLFTTFAFLRFDLLSLFGWMGLSDYVRAEFLRNRQLSRIQPL